MASKVLRTIVMAFVPFLPLSLQAVPIYWDISFEDDNGNDVGGGWFSFDPATETPIRTGPFNETEFTVSTAIDQLDWTVQGMRWSAQDASVLWWVDEVGDTHPAGHLARQRGPSFVWNDRWFVGDPFLGTKLLFMDFDQADARSGGGTWGQQALPKYAPPGYTPDDGVRGLFGSGTWRAIARAPVVPIPPTAPLFALGLVLLIWLGSRKRARLG